VPRKEWKERNEEKRGAITFGKSASHRDDDEETREKEIGKKQDGSPSWPGSGNALKSLVQHYPISDGSPQSTNLSRIHSFTRETIAVDRSSSTRTAVWSGLVARDPRSNVESWFIRHTDRFGAMCRYVRRPGERRNGRRCVPDMALARDRIRNRQASRREIARSSQGEGFRTVVLSCCQRRRRRKGLRIAVPTRNGTRGTVCRVRTVPPYYRAARIPWQRIPFEGYTSWSAMCSRSDGLSACLPAYLQSFALLPLFPFFTAIPYAATWSVYLANVGFARVLAESPDDPPERRSNFAAPRTAERTARRFLRSFSSLHRLFLRYLLILTLETHFLLSKQNCHAKLTLVLILTIWFILIRY